MTETDASQKIGRLRGIDPRLVGAGCGIVAALAYTASNVCLRSVVNCDPIFVSCVKAIPTVILVGPLLLLRIVRGQGILSSPRTLAQLTVAALVGQLCGNVAFQWSLGVVGMGLTVALCFGTMISSAALLGWLVLGEHVTRQMIVASSILIAAIGILSLGVSTVQKQKGSSRLSAAVPRSTTAQAVAARTVVPQRQWWLIAAGIAAPCLSGLAYAVLNVSIRHHGQIGTPLSTILTLVGLVGFVALGLLSYGRLGIDGIRATRSEDLWMMAAAGVWNALAFGSLAKALHLTSVVVANGLNASQTAMAALAGVVFFDETVTISLILGTILTMLGLMLMRGNPRAIKTEGQAPALIGASALSAAGEAAIAAELRCDSTSESGCAGTQRLPETSA